MKPSIRPVANALLALLAFTGAWLTYAQADAGSRYSDDPRNVRVFRSPADPSRGRIVTADGVVLAEDGDTGRRYPQGSRYAHVVGYAVPSGRDGIESTRFAALGSRDDGSLTAWLLELFGADLGPPDVHLTILDPLQRAAVEGLGGRPGAVVAIDPRTGAILAYASSPAFDPNDIEDDLGDEEADDRLLDRAADHVLPPGSTFKVIVAGAALRAGLEPDDEIAAGTAYTPPTGEPIRNAGGRGCGSDPITLTAALVVSCNTAFARLAVDLGGSLVVGAAERAGLNAPLPWETGAVLSSIPSADALDADPPSLAQTGIGERDVRVTPLLMATVAAAVANDGVAMTPFVVAEVVAPDGEVLEAAIPHALRRVFRTRDAESLRAMMRAVVEEGTGRPAAVSGVEVAGKTGTAEGSGGPHAWFIGFAPAEQPTIAIAVVVEGGGSGGRVAGPIAAAVIEAWMALEGS